MTRSQLVQVRIKYAVDRIVALIGLVLALPLLALISLAILIDSGRPVFFRQPRPGYDAEIFRVYKFRTMIQDADDHLDEHGRPTRTRVTRTGRFLRSTSLDELPNMINILAGEMSFIGPRPSLVSQLDHYTAEQAQRFRMRPGISGLAQVNGRNQLPWSERLELDNEYIDNYSLWMDLRILARTVVVVLRREGVELDRNPDVAADFRPGSPVSTPAITPEGVDKGVR